MQMKRTHDPDATLDYSWDWQAWLGSDTIVSTTVTTPDTSLSISNVTHTDTAVTAWISGGTDKVSADVTCHIVTDAGREDDWVLRLDVRNHPAPASGPCDWPLSYIECHDTSALDSLTEAARASVEAMATEYLWNWTGRAYGQCAVDYRPCFRDCPDGGYASGGWPLTGGSWSPVLQGGKWRGVECGSCGGACNCGGAAPLRLPWPVSEISEILVDGVALPRSAYRLDSRSLLQRTDGESWSLCQNLSLPPSEPGTWQVTYLWGLPVPIGGQVAAGLLASELAMAFCNDNRCQLPQRIQSITRQGVTVTLLDQFEDVAKGRTGIWAVDAWVASVTQPPRGGRVRSPDIPLRRVRA